MLVRDAEGSMRYRMYRKGGPKFVELIIVSNSYGILYVGDDDLDVSTDLSDYTVS